MAVSAVGQRLLSAVVSGLLPVALTAGAIAILFHAVPTRAVPYITDEVAFWNQIAVFEAVGLDGGYITVDEQPSRASWSHFGPHGPVFPAVYGVLARLAGWHPWSGPLFGAALLTGGIVIWGMAASPRAWPSFLFWATFWPVMIAMPNTLQESLHFVLGCVLATAIHLTLVAPVRWRSATTVALVAMLLLASLIRPVWGLLAIPLGAVVASGRGMRPAGGALLGALLTVATFVVFMYVSAPYPGAPGNVVFTLVRQPVSTVDVLLTRTVENLGTFLSWNAPWLELLARYELLGLGIVSGVLALRNSSQAQRWRLAFVAASAAIVFAAVLGLGLNNIWQQYRTLTPVLLLLWLVAGVAHPRLLLIAAGVHALAAPVALSTFIEVQQPRFEQDRMPDITAFASATRGRVSYDGRLPPWGNSLLVDAENYLPPLLGLPKGVGVSAVLHWELVPRPPRSRYLVLRPSDRDALLTHQPSLRLRKLGDTAIGELFENPAWQR